MRFYRLEKDSYFKDFFPRAFKALGYAILITILLASVIGYKFMIVSSGSMEPKLPVGSLIMVTPAEYEDLEIGDIVTMNKGGVYLTHRIVGKKNSNNIILPKPGDVGYDETAWENGFWYTQGDNSNTPDGILSSEEVIGVVDEAHCFTWVGDLIIYIKGNTTMLIVYAVLLMFAISTLFWLREKMTPDDIECYENDEDEE